MSFSLSAALVLWWKKATIVLVRVSLKRVFHHPSGCKTWVVCPNCFAHSSDHVGAITGYYSNNGKERVSSMHPAFSIFHLWCCGRLIILCGWRVGSFSSNMDRYLEFLLETYQSVKIINHPGRIIQRLSYVNWTSFTSLIQKSSFNIVNNFI